MYYLFNKCKELKRNSASDSAYSLIEFVIILLLMGIVYIVIGIKFNPIGDYKLSSASEEIVSNLFYCQFLSMRHYDRTMTTQDDIIENDLFGLFFPESNANQTYSLIHRLESDINQGKNFSLPTTPILHNVYYSVIEEGTEKCVQNSTVIFDSLGRPADQTGKPCEHSIYINICLMQECDQESKSTIMISPSGCIGYKSECEKKL